MRYGRPRHAAGLVHAASALVVCLGGLLGAGVRGADPAPAVSGTAAAAATPLPYWQAPAVPAAVIHGGAIPAGWQPQAVPYQGVGPDGRPLTMYVAPTYVFTYQSGPPVLAAPGVNRRPPLVVPGQSTSNAYGWNYQSRGATAVPVALPPATVAQYRPLPYQFPPDSRALTGTPIVPPSTPLPGPPQPMPPPAFPPAIQQPLAPPPGQWVPSNAPPPPGVAPPPNAGWGAAAPALAATAVPFAAAAAATSPNPPPTASLMPPIAPIQTTPIQASPMPMASVGAAPAGTPPGAPASNTHLWKVVGVHDGDTVTCVDEANQQQKIRLAEIDAPEVSQDFGKVSREALAGMVFGKTIQVVDDGKDRYGRWIGHLSVDGLDVNRQMVATGMAWHYADYSKDASLGTLQSQAQAQRLGLWSQPNPMPPWEYRKNATKKAA